MLIDWFYSDNGIRPCSWEVLIAVLRHTRFGDVSNRIKRKLVQSMYVCMFKIYLKFTFVLLYFLRSRKNLPSDLWLILDMKQSMYVCMYVCKMHMMLNQDSR